jgi:hypothetical protein
MLASISSVPSPRRARTAMCMAQSNWTRVFSGIEVIIIVVMTMMVVMWTLIMIVVEVVLVVDLTVMNKDLAISQIVRVISIVAVGREGG